MNLTTTAAPAETTAVTYRRAHAGKLMVIDRPEQPCVAGDFFRFDSVGTHPTGLIVTGIFENGRRSHIMAAAVREANQGEIDWLDSSTTSAS
jgi:hypothetical protein